MPGKALYNRLLELGATALFVPWGDRVIDLADSARVITAYNGAHASNGAIQFDGFDDFVDVADSADFNTTNPFTIWLRFRDGGGASNGRIAFYKTSSTNAFEVDKTSLGGAPRIKFSIAQGATTVARRVDDDELGGTGTINDVGCVYSGGSLTLYANGQAVTGTSQTFSMDDLDRLRLGADNGIDYTSVGLEAFAIVKSTALTAGNFAQLHTLAISNPAAGGGLGGAS